MAVVVNEFEVVVPPPAPATPPEQQQQQQAPGPSAQEMERLVRRQEERYARLRAH